MTIKERIEAIKARHAAATKGPWYSVNCDDEMAMNLDFISAKDLHQFGEIEEHNSEDIIAITLLQYPRYADNPRFEENNTFITHSWDDVRWLLERIEALEKVAEAAREHYKIAHRKQGMAQYFCECPVCKAISALDAKEQS